MHWYYFKTISKNMPPGTKIRINIRNWPHGGSLYEEGMLPKICYDTPEANLRAGPTRGWHVDPNVTRDVRFF